MALRDGKSKALGIKLLLFGAEYVGKTCVAATLVDDPFQDTSATQGADIQICNTCNWKKITKEEATERLQNEFHSKLKTCAESKMTTSVEQAASNTDKILPLPTVDTEDIKAVKVVKDGASRVFKIRGGINVTMLDFAGQVQYHNTHSVFIRKENVIMVVFNASLPLSKNVKVRSSTPLREDEMTNSQNIHFWMKTVHSICHEPGDSTDKASLLPIIFLVATHLDLLGDAAENTQEQIIQTLAMELEGKPYARHLAGHKEGLQNALRKYCIFLSNKVRDPNTILQLQKVIIEVAAPILNRKHPLVFLKIERELMSLDKGVITIEEFQEITSRCGFVAAIESKEFAYALQHFHHHGIVLNFSSVESLKRLVILSPHWLTKLLSYALIAHPYQSTGNGRDISYKNLKDHGILVESFLIYILDWFNNSGVGGHQLKLHEAVDLMKRFGFLAPISSKAMILEGVKNIKEDEMLYVVPSLLPHDKESEKAVPKRDEQNVRIVYFYFPDEFLPPMLFSQVITMCINRNEDKREDLLWYVIPVCN